MKKTLFDTWFDAVVVPRLEQAAAEQPFTSDSPSIAAASELFTGWVRGEYGRPPLP